MSTSAVLEMIKEAMRNGEEDERPRQTSDVQARILVGALQKLQERCDLHIGKLLVLKRGLESCYKTYDGEVYIVTELIEPPHLDVSSGSGTPFIARRLDVRLMCVRPDGASVEFAMDSRYFEPYTGEIAA